MNWVNKHNLPVIEAIKYNDQPCLEINDLWQTLHSTFNRAQHRQIDISLLNEIVNKCSTLWMPFSEVEFISSISKCNNSLTPSPDKLLWRHLKTIVKDSKCLKKIVDIANVCFKLDYWLLHFKILISIIVPKSNKELYDSPKLFRPIVLLNTIGKLIEKVIGERF